MPNGIIIKKSTQETVAESPITQAQEAIALTPTVEEIVQEIADIASEPSALKTLEKAQGLTDAIKAHTQAPIVKIASEPKSAFARLQVALKETNTPIERQGVPVMVGAKLSKKNTSLVLALSEKLDIDLLGKSINGDIVFFTTDSKWQQILDALPKKAEHATSVSGDKVSYHSGAQ